MIVDYYLLLKEIKKTITNSVGLFDTLSNGCMTSFEFVKHLHGFLEVTIVQKILSLRWIVIACIKLVSNFGDKVLKLVNSEGLFENSHLLEIISIIW